MHEFRQLCCKSDEVLHANKNIKSEIIIKTDRYFINKHIFQIINIFYRFEDASENNSDYKADETFELDFDEDDDENLLERHKQMKRKSRHKKQSNDETDEEIKNESDSNIDLDDLEQTEKQMQCKYCDLKFRYKVRLKNHEMKHLHGLKCHICSKYFRGFVAI